MKEQQNNIWYVGKEEALSVNQEEQNTENKETTEKSHNIDKVK